LRDPVVRFAGQLCIFKQKRLSGGIQPRHFWIQFSAIPENSHDEDVDVDSTSEPEVSPGLEKLLDLWVKKMVIPLQVKYGDKIEMIGKEV